MQKTLLVANWKSYKTISDALNWIEEFAKIFKEEEGKEVILCPSFLLLYPIKAAIDDRKLNIKLGAQDVSFLDEGPFTGEVSSRQIKEVADYAIIGHSERRTNLKEDNQAILKKVKQAVSSSLIPIFCIQDENTEIPEEDVILAYEPLSSISTSSPDAKEEDPEEVLRIARLLKSKKPNSPLLYGGSVDSSNVSSFTKSDLINGVLVGGKSLSPSEFFAIYENS